MEKRIEINEDRVMLLILDDDYIGTKKTISEYQEYDFDMIKSYNLSQWSDYDFFAVTDVDVKDTLSFDFDVNHPLYFSFLHLLNGDEELIINDDLVKEKNKRFIKIYKYKNKIIMSFVNKTNDEYDLPKFKVFVENLDCDSYSKIDEKGFDIKKRLYKFFNLIICTFKFRLR